MRVYRNANTDTNNKVRTPFPAIIPGSGCMRPTPSSSCKPGIYFDEVQRHPVGFARGQHERLLDVISAAFNIVATTDVSKLAAFGDFAAVPALEVVRISKVCSERCLLYTSPSPRD